MTLRNRLLVGAITLGALATVQCQPRVKAEQQRSRFPAARILTISAQDYATMQGTQLHQYCAYGVVGTGWQSGSASASVQTPPNTDVIVAGRLAEPYRLAGTALVRKTGLTCPTWSP